MSDWKNDAEFAMRKVDLRRRAMEALFETSIRAIDIGVISESPIEELMLNALALVDMPLFHSNGGNVLVAPTAVVMAKDRDLDFESLKRSKGEFILIVQQAKIASFRVDFLVVARFFSTDIHKIVIECDGHDFHERTKEQAEKDKSRDRALQLEGCKVFRFSGREIWRDALSCARDVSKMLFNISYSELTDVKD